MDMPLAHRLPAALRDDTGGTVLYGLLAATAIAVPILTALPPSSALNLSPYVLTLLGKYLCYALLALSVDLVWGYVGILSLGHGAFFAIGGYAMGIRTARVDALTFGLGSGIAGMAGVALSQLTNVGPNLGQAYIIDSFMVVVFGGVGNLWGALIGGLTMGVISNLLEPAVGAVLAKIVVLVALILFIQRRPRGLFPQTGRAAEQN